MELIPFENNDISALTELQPPEFTDIVPPHAWYLSQALAYPFKLVRENKIVGIGTSILHDDVAWLAHIVVHPEFRNQGIGNIITKELVHFSKSNSAKSIFLIATEMGAPLYTKLGFVTETEYLFYKDLDVSKFESPSDALVPMEESHFSEIKFLDLKYSQENRWEHLLAHGKNGFVYVKNKKIEGYYLPSWGEGLILAENSTAGIELMKKRFSTKENAVFPIDNIAASDYMESKQYLPFRKARRMYLGKRKDWIPSAIYNRIGGNLG